MKIDKIDRLRIASPCPVGWEQMTGDDRVRFCDLCNLNVYDIVQLTHKEAEALIAGSEGRICARLYRRQDGTVITRDCPVGLRAIRRRVTKVAGAVFATLMSLSSVAVGQKQSSKSECKQQVKITRKSTQSPSAGSVFSGTIFDQIGAVVQGAKVRFTDHKTKKSYETQSDSEGRFLTTELPEGTYNVAVKSAGFKNLEITNVKLAARENIIAEMTLLVDGDSVVVGILVETPLIDTSTPGTTIISGEMIRKLPIP